MRVYISGAVTGSDDYLTRFAEAEEMLVGKGLEVINPVRILRAFPEMKYEECMKVCLYLLRMCDSIYLLKGWENSRGANRELGYAMAKGMKIVKEEE